MTSKRIPKTFKLAGLAFNVEFVDNLKNGDNYGEYVDVTHTIKLANKVKIDDIWIDVPIEIKWNSFWHELFHIFNYYWNTEFDESLAQTFANFMTEYLQSKRY